MCNSVAEAEPVVAGSFWPESVKRDRRLLYLRLQIPFFLSYQMFVKNFTTLTVYFKVAKTNLKLLLVFSSTYLFNVLTSTT